MTISWHICSWLLYFLARLFDRYVGLLFTSNNTLSINFNFLLYWKFSLILSFLWFVSICIACPSLYLQIFTMNLYYGCFNEKQKAWFLLFVINPLFFLLTGDFKRMNADIFRFSYYQVIFLFTCFFQFPFLTFLPSIKLIKFSLFFPFSS